MAQSLSDVSAFAAAHVNLGIGHAAQAMQQLGGQRRTGGTLEELVRQLGRLLALSKSRRRTPDALEEQTYARAVRAMVYTALLLGYHHPGPPAPAAAAPPTPPAVAVVAGH